MKKRSIQVIAALVAIALAILAGFILFSLERNELPGHTNDLRPLPQANLAPTVTPVPTPDLSIYKTDPKWIWWNEQSARDPQFEWKMPIRFFGKVVDENGLPVAGATASFIWTDMSPHGSSTAEAVSDGAGLFGLQGVKGKRMQVRVNKEGYYSNPNNVFSFEYAAFFESNYHEPDAKKPVVFRLRKQGGIPKELVVRETMMGIEPNGTPHFIDLGTTRKSGADTGDISVRIKRTAPKEQKRYDWSAVIEGVNGAGLIESGDEFMFEAPKDGYQSGYTYEFIQSSPDWKNNLRKQYYVMGEGGKMFGRLEVEFMPKYQNTAALAIRFFVNPTGSRNLEFEPNTVLPR